jgi:hypothetical protein
MGLITHEHPAMVHVHDVIEVMSRTRRRRTTKAAAPAPAPGCGIVMSVTFPTPRTCFDESV